MSGVSRRSGKAGVRLEPMNKNNNSAAVPQAPPPQTQTTTTTTTLLRLQGDGAAADAGPEDGRHNLPSNHSRGLGVVGSSSEALPKLSPEQSSPDVRGGDTFAAAAMRTPATARRRSPLDPISFFAQESMPTEREVAKAVTSSTHFHGGGGGGDGHGPNLDGGMPHMKASLIPLVAPTGLDLSRKAFGGGGKLSSSKAAAALSEDESSTADGDSKRKSAPPDLLELSNMYFDRQQKIMAHDFRLTESHRITRPAPVLPLSEHIRPATSDLALMTNDPSYTKPGVLTPISNRDGVGPRQHRPTVEEARIKINDGDNSSGGGGGRKKSLHMSVNFSRQGWRQALDPLGKKRSREDIMADSSRIRLGRTNTYVVEKDEDDEKEEEEDGLDGMELES